MPPDTDPEHGHRLVAQEAHDGRQHHRPEEVDRLGPEEAEDRLVARRHRARRDREHDDEAGEVLDPAETVREAAGGGPSRQEERNRERHGGGGVSEVVDAIGEPGDAARRDHDHDLKPRGQNEGAAGPLEGP